MCTPLRRRLAIALAGAVSAALVAAALAEPTAPKLELKSGQEIAFAASVADGKVSLGPARLEKPGAEPRDGEISVSVVKQGLSPYAELTAVEKTSVPVDFVATGLIGDILIDEIVVCGRLDAPTTARIASGAWRVSLNRFAVRADGAAQPGAGGLPCPK